MEYSVAFLDDESTLLEAAKVLLPQQGIRVHTFDSWETFEKQSPSIQCLICDWNLLGENPKNKLEKFKNILIISGIEPADIQEYSFLKKPFRFQTLIEKVKKNY